MKKEDYKIVFIRGKDSNTYTAWIPALSGLIVQVDRLEDAPVRLGKSFECLLKNGFKVQNYEIIEI